MKSVQIIPGVSVGLWITLPVSPWYTVEVPENRKAGEHINGAQDYRSG